MQEWASSIRCLEQKWPLQKLQSPTMSWAGSLHSLKLHLGLRAGIVKVARGGRTAVDVVCGGNREGIRVRRGSRGEEIDGWRVED